MGIDNSRTIQMDNLQARLRKCIKREQKNCPIYGDVLEVEYDGHILNVAHTQTGMEPRQDSVHYFIPPDALIFPNFTLLEDHCPDSLENLLDIILSICEMAMKSEGYIGMGKQRVAYFGRWGTVGEKEDDCGNNKMFQPGGENNANNYLKSFLYERKSMYSKQV